MNSWNITSLKPKSSFCRRAKRMWSWASCFFSSKQNSIEEAFNKTTDQKQQQQQTHPEKPNHSQIPPPQFLRGFFCFISSLTHRAQSLRKSEFLCAEEMKTLNLFLPYIIKVKKKKLKNSEPDVDKFREHILDILSYCKTALARTSTVELYCVQKPGGTFCKHK